MDFPDRADGGRSLTDAIVRHRRIIYITAAVFFLLAINGRWRIGRDSACYRGLGHALATGQGYSFGKFASHQIYPGLPVLLAGLEKMFGPSDWPPIVMINAMAAGCVILTYRLVKMRFSQWMAIVVASGVAINGWFLELSQEIRDDIPFLLGMLLALYGWELMRDLFGLRGGDAAPVARSRAEVIKAPAYLLIGLGFAASMRPTFWILAIAWVLICVWGLLVGPRRGFYAVCLALLLAVWVSIAFFDPRTKGFQPLQGGYERDAMVSLKEAGASIQRTLPTFPAEFSYSFFGQKFFPVGTEFFVFLVVVSSAFLLRGHPLWTVVILVTIVVTLFMTTVPRYYVMVLPLLLVGWVLLFFHAAMRVPARWQGIVLLTGLLLFAGMNLSRCIKVIAQQRGWAGRDVTYRTKWKDELAMSDLIKQYCPADARIIGPAASIMRYVSGRAVLMQRDLLPSKSPMHYPAEIKKLGITHAVFPPQLYTEGERIIRELMDRGVIVPTQRIAHANDMVLARVEIVVPPGDWRKRPTSTTRLTVKTDVEGKIRPTPAQRAKKRKLALLARREAAAKKLEREIKEQRLRKQKREAAARAAAKIRKQKKAAAAATQPTTAPATQPTTRPIADASSQFLGLSVEDRLVWIEGLLFR